MTPGSQVPRLCLRHRLKRTRWPAAGTVPRRTSQRGHLACWAPALRRGWAASGSSAPRCAACSTAWRRSVARPDPQARHAGGPTVTAGFDSATPNMARVYDYWLGGKDNYPADRAEAERLLGIYPPLRDLVRENRAFMPRLSAGPPGRVSASSSTWAPGSPPPPQSTRPHGRSYPWPGSSTSTVIPWCYPMPARCSPPATGWPWPRRTCATPRRCWPTRSCGPSSTRPNLCASSSARSCTSWTPVPPGRSPRDTRG